VLLQPADMGAERRYGDCGGDPRCLGPEVDIAARTQQGSDAESGKKEQRPVLGHHANGHPKSGKRGIGGTRGPVGAQEPERGNRPAWHQGGVDVELQHVKVEKGNECEQDDANQSLGWRQVVLKQNPCDPQRKRRRRHREQIEGRIGYREQCKPSADDHRGERRVLWKAESQIARPGDKLRHIEMHILAALRDRAVNRPDGDEDREQHDNRSVAPARVRGRGDDPVESLCGERSNRQENRRSWFARLMALRVSRRLNVLAAVDVNLGAVHI